MVNRLPFDSHGLDIPALSPFKELGAFEALWAREGMSFKKIALMVKANPASGSVMSHFVQEAETYEYAQRTMALLSRAGINDFDVCLQGTLEYPKQLLSAEHPIPFFYYQGWLDLLATRSVSVVGTRKPSKKGIARTRRLVKHLIADKFTIISGLAAGIDTVAHDTAMEEGGRTIGVIGTPLTQTYPKSNSERQAKIARDFLLISQIPVWRYVQQKYWHNRWFFPERNITMSALSEATVIVEAGKTSGTLTQARAALKQGRKLFILDSCFQNPELGWPEKFAAKGAIRVKRYEDIKQHLGR